MILKNIEQELAKCRTAWAAAPQAQLAHGLHHDRHIEKLREPIENRIAYILTFKPKGERAQRFRWLRPWPGSVPMSDRQAYDAIEKAYDARQNLARTDDAAIAAWDAAIAAWQKGAEFQAEHARLFPDCPWDGEKFF